MEMKVHTAMNVTYLKYNNLPNDAFKQTFHCNFAYGDYDLKYSVALLSDGLRK